MVPANLRAEWGVWVSEGYDSRFNCSVTPVNVLRYPSSYGHLRPDNLPHVGDYAFIPEALLPALREGSAVPDWFWDGDTDRNMPVVRIFCRPPPFDTGLLCFDTIKPWVPMAFVPLGDRESGSRS